MKHHKVNNLDDGPSTAAGFDRDFDDEETRADDRLPFVSSRYNDPRKAYIEEKEAYE